jgi:carbamoyl-phosphate synthase large subunit
MTDENPNILILSAGRRVELVQAFQAEARKRNLRSQVLATDLHPGRSAACQIADGAIQLPRVGETGYMDLLLEACLRNQVRVVVPTIDTELLGLARARSRFADHGIHLVISDEGLVAACRDKRRTSELFAGLGVNTPAIYDKNSLSFPCFVKPYDGSRSIGAALIESQDAVTPDMLADPKLMFMQFIDGSHDEYTVDIYYDRSGHLQCLVPRQRLEVRDGEISKGITRKHHIYEYLVEKARRIEGARGCLTLQLFANIEAGHYAALEINPRFGGGFPLSYAAGANYPGWLIDEYISARDVPFFDGWESDLLMLRYDAKVLVHGGS